MLGSASSALFREAIPPDLDPALLLAELRNLRPLMLELHQARDTIAELRELTPALVQDYRRTLDEHRLILARLDTAPAKMDRIDDLIQLLDELEVLVRRQ